MKPISIDDLPPDLQSQARTLLGPKPDDPPIEYAGPDKPERELQKLCEQELNRRGLWYLHLSPRAREKIGCPDLLFCFHVHVSPYNHPVPCAVELKSERGRLTKEQSDTLTMMSGNGWRVYLVRSIKEFFGVLDGTAEEWESDAASTPIPQVHPPH